MREIVTTATLPVVSLMATNCNAGVHANFSMSIGAVRFCITTLYIVQHHMIRHTDRYTDKQTHRHA